MDDRPLLALEHEGWVALSTSGEAAHRFYDEVLADDVLMLLPGGLLLDQRSAALDAMGGDPWSSFDLQGARVLHVTDDVAVVAYRCVAERDGRRYSALCSSTYVVADGAWRLTVHQQTPI